MTPFNKPQVVVLSATVQTNEKIKYLSTEKYWSGVTMKKGNNNKKQAKIRE